MSIPEFQICFIMPKGTINPLAFRESLFLLRNSLRQLGYRTEIVPNQIARDKINIILGYNLMEFGAIHQETVYIPWQLEHLPGTHWFNDSAVQIFKHAAAIWDFSSINMELLKEHGIESRLLRLGYHESMKTFQPVPEQDKDCDVLFFGAINDRRKKILDELVRCGLEVKRITGVFGPERDEHIARARVVLNIHYHESGIQESVRISHLLTNEVFVVSEDSQDDPFPGVDLVAVPFDELVETCVRYAEDAQKRETLRARNHHEFSSSCKMIDYLDPLAKEVVLKMM